MITFIRNLAELMVIADSSSDIIKSNPDLNTSNASVQKSKYIELMSKEQISLPDITNETRSNWVKSKKAIKRFFEDLDYNNQNISSYDITMMSKQEYKDYHDAA